MGLTGIGAMFSLLETLHTEDGGVFLGFALFTTLFSTRCSLYFNDIMKCEELKEERLELVKQLENEIKKYSEK